MEILGIREEDFLNKDLIKIYNGIAGASKSTAIDNYFAGKGIDYIRCNSTNRQKFDAAQRFGEHCKCFTSASALFKTKGTLFYYEEKEVESEHVVIDEILLSDRKVLDWVKGHRGQLNIIISTDDRQLLAPGQERMLHEFHELEQDENSVVSHLTYSMRPINDETRAIYDEYYNADGDEYADMSRFPHISFSDMEYNHNDVYLTHTREIEEHMYKEFDLSNDYTAELVAKGHLASRKGFDVNKYPIVSQERAEREKISSYLQIAKVGTPTRYQGSEVYPGEKLYYIINSNSLVSNREFYTVVTRCKDIKSLVIVTADWTKNKKLDSFNGKPFKRELPVILRGNYDAPETEKSFDDMWTAAEKEQLDDVIWSKDMMVINGKPIARFTLNKEYEKAPISITNQIQKEGTLSMDGEQVYGAIEGKLDAIHSVHQYDRTEYMSKDFGFRYQLDLHSAYTHVLKNEWLPVYGDVTTEYDKNKMNFYIIKDANYTKDGVVTDDMANWCVEHGIDVEYIFSVDKQFGSKTGDKLMSLVYKDKKSKAKVKLIKWGALQKHYIEPREFDPETNEPGCYVRKDKQCYELLMAAITSQLLYYMVQLQDLLNPHVPGYNVPTKIVTDAIHYCYTMNNMDTPAASARVDMFKAWMEEHMPGYDFRIKNNLTGEVLYQSYKDLK